MNCEVFSVIYVGGQRVNIPPGEDDGAVQLAWAQTDGDDEVGTQNPRVARSPGGERNSGKGERGSHINPSKRTRRSEVWKI